MLSVDTFDQFPKVFIICTFLSFPILEIFIDEKLGIIYIFISLFVISPKTIFMFSFTGCSGSGLGVVVSTGDGSGVVVGVISVGVLLGVVTGVLLEVTTGVLLGVVLGVGFGDWVVVCSLVIFTYSFDT